MLSLRYWYKFLYFPDRAYLGLLIWGIWSPWRSINETIKSIECVRFTQSHQVLED